MIIRVWTAPEESGRLAGAGADLAQDLPVLQLGVSALTRPDTLLGQELRRIRLTLAEGRPLAQITAGSMFESYATGFLLYAECADAFRLARADYPIGGELSSYAAHHQIDEQQVLDKLLAVGPTADLALRDGLSRWWESGDAHDNDAASFRQVGITIVEPHTAAASPARDDVAS